MSLKKPLNNEEIDQMLKDSAKEQAALDRDILNCDKDACEKIYLKLPPGSLIPLECEKMREMLELQKLRKSDQ